MSQRAKWGGSLVVVSAVIAAIITGGGPDGGLAPVHYFIAPSGCALQTEAMARNNPDAPFCSLAQADTVVQSGSTIYVREGDYPGDGVANADKASRTTVRPYPGETASFDYLAVDQSDYWEYRGLEVTGHPTPDAYGDTGNGPLEYEGRVWINGPTANVTINGLNIHDTVAGFYIKSSTGDNANLTIKNNTVSNVSCVRYHIEAGGTPDCKTWDHDNNPGTAEVDTRKAGYGLAIISGNGADMVIDGNTFDDTDGDGIQLACGDGCQITDNRFVNMIDDVGNEDHADSLQFPSTMIDATIARNRSDGPGACFQTGSVSGLTWTNVVFAENICTGTSNYCFASLPAGANITFRNNTCWNSQYGAIEFNGLTQAQSMSNLRIYNNLWGPVVGNGAANDADSMGQHVITGLAQYEGNVVVEKEASQTIPAGNTGPLTAPELAGLLVDADGEDFRPASGSLLVGAGVGPTVDSPLSSTDHEGRTRPVDTVDVGAYERQAGDP